MLERIIGKLQAVCKKTVIVSLILMVVMGIGVVSVSADEVEAGTGAVACSGNAPSEKHQCINGKWESPEETQTPPSSTQFGLMDAASLINSIFTPFIGFLATVSGELMGNDWIYGTGASVYAVREKMETVLNTMWQVVRDLVNYAFILVLLVVAFMSVFTAGSEMHSKFEIKTMLPKIIIALVAVNFTWFGAKVVLDTANVATHVVFAIPQTAMAIADIDLAESKASYCIPDVVEILEGTGAASGASENSKLKDASKGAENSKKMGKNCESLPPEIKGKFKIKSWKKANIFETMNGHTTTGLLAFGVLNVQDLPVSINPNQSMDQIGMDAIVSLIIMAIILVTFLVMTIVLFIRIILLWLNIILSPVFVLMPILSDLGINEESESFGISAFVKQAFLPAMMAFPLVVGLTMIIVGRSFDLDGAASSIGGIKFEGEVMKNVNKIQQLMWYMLAVIIMWASVGVAEKSSEFAGSIVQPISDGIKSGAKWVAKSPMYMPWIPVPSKNDDGKLENMAIADFARMPDILNRDRMGDQTRRLRKAGLYDESQGGESNLKPEIKRALELLKDKNTDVVGFLQESAGKSKSEIIERMESGNSRLGQDGIALARNIKSSGSEGDIANIIKTMARGAGISTTDDIIKGVVDSDQFNNRTVAAGDSNANTSDITVEEQVDNNYRINLGGGTSFITNKESLKTGDAAAWTEMKGYIGDTDQSIRKLAKAIEGMTGPSNNTEKKEVLERAVASGQFAMLSDGAKLREIQDLMNIPTDE